MNYKASQNSEFTMWLKTCILAPTWYNPSWLTIQIMDGSNVFIIWMIYSPCTRDLIMIPLILTWSLTQFQQKKQQLNWPLVKRDKFRDPLGDQRPPDRFMELFIWMFFGKEYSKVTSCR